jgi:3-dehydroquinate dehydratase
LPTYVTNYRFRCNDGKSDDVLAEELVGIASCGATIVDVMGDMYCRTPGELTTDESAIERQKALIDRIHAVGGKVLMSSHTKRVMCAEEVLHYALEQQKRGADIAKIVSQADTAADEVEAMRAILLLREKLSIPFLYLVGGECKILRRVGGKLGNCMHLGVYEYDALATPEQPLIRDLKSAMELLY